MNPDEQLRLECLRLAIAGNYTGDPIRDAKEMFCFVKDDEWAGFKSVSPEELAELAEHAD